MPKKLTNAGINKAGHDFAAILASNDGTAGCHSGPDRRRPCRQVLVTGQDADLAACQRIVQRHPEQ